MDEPEKCVFIVLPWTVRQIGTVFCRCRDGGGYVTAYNDVDVIVMMKRVLMVQQ